MRLSQVAHAAGAGSRKHPPETYVVVLGVPSEAVLSQLLGELRDAGIPCTGIVESDPPYSEQLMAIGCELVRDRSSIRKILSCLPLAGKEISKAA